MRPMRPLLVILSLIALSGSARANEFVRGDLNGDENVSLSDLSLLVTYLFDGGGTPGCLDSADANDDGKLDLGDITTLLGAVLNGELSIPAPFPVIGEDPTDDSIGCGEGPTGGPLGSEIDHVFLNAAVVEGGTGPALAPGQAPAILSVHLSTEASLRGYTIVIQYDPEVITSATFDFDSGLPESLGAELRVSSILEVVGEDGPAGFVTGHVLLEALPPFSTAAFPPGTGYYVGNLVLEVSASAPVGGSTSLTFAALPGPLGKSTEFTAEEHASIEPNTTGIELPIVAAEALFVRGDVTRDGAVDLADVIVLLEAILAGGPSPSCLDAMDVDDTGAVDIADPIRLLELLFDGDPSLPIPYPHPGADPTADSLGC